MSATPQFTEPPRSHGGALSTGTKILLFVGLPLLALALLLVSVGFLFSAFRSTPVALSDSAGAGSSVLVEVPNAQLDFRPGEADEVRAEAVGRYSGPPPSLTVTSDGDETVIRGGCVHQWLTRCSMRITVTLPASTDVRVVGRNGKVTGEGLTGDIDITTSNGGLELADVTGQLSLHTTNGAIGVHNSSSNEVVARTTNGGVIIDLEDAPRSVDVETTNGRITVRVPADEDYDVEAQTTNGAVRTDGLPVDRQADRQIVAKTVNGDITVEPRDD
jgi:Putative adhesin